MSGIDLQCVVRGAVDQLRRIVLQLAHQFLQFAQGLAGLLQQGGGLAQAILEEAAHVVFVPAQQLVEAARTLGSEPKALQLRYLQTLSDLSSEKATTIVFPLPLDLIKPFLENK